MFRTIVAITATLTAALWLSSCSKEIEYNSNSGYDGSRDSASQLLVNTSKVDDVSAPDGDNEARETQAPRPSQDPRPFFSYFSHRKSGSVNRKE